MESSIIQKEIQKIEQYLADFLKTISFLHSDLSGVKKEVNQKANDLKLEEIRKQIHGI
ncbi:MAG: hypothetical protein ACYC5G_01900 [Candidatus Doudnabacteria bacterium]